MFLLISPRNEKCYYLPNSASHQSASSSGLPKLQLGAFNLITREIKDLKTILIFYFTILSYNFFKDDFEWLNRYLMLRACAI